MSAAGDAAAVLVTGVSIRDGDAIDDHLAIASGLEFEDADGVVAVETQNAHVAGAGADHLASEIGIAAVANRYLHPVPVHLGRATGVEHTRQHRDRG